MLRRICTSAIRARKPKLHATSRFDATFAPTTTAASPAAKETDNHKLLQPGLQFGANSQLVPAMQEQEVDVEAMIVNSIYDNAMEKWAEGVWNVTVPFENHPLVLRLRFPPSYPEVPPQLLTVSDERKEEAVKTALSTCYVKGEVAVFALIDECLSNIPEIEEEVEPQDPEVEALSSNIANWSLSEPIVDRKSTFEARAFAITSEKQVQPLLEDLKRDKRIARATHNMWAWQLKDAQGLVARNCDDDGESAAGGRLLFLLERAHVFGVLVVVSRWYGGTKLGPDRFKHISNCARDALKRGDFIQ